ncbi:MAG: patatin-like phospholipase family protein [Wenzhouxiangellaceae bacterium]|nr:patatin-like phospholipase family protein [Wenzhouxiangellaceae bacterium]MBS3746581.1 patatin-like phospholipase family protein [Wenzhouxiangellaceae bacterium]
MRASSAIRRSPRRRVHSRCSIVLAAAWLLFSPLAAAEKCEPPRIGLALGSGGAGGLAHIAMLAVFEELEMEPAAVSGTSIGAIVGALYAAGLESSEIQDLFREFGDSALNPFSGLLEDGDSPGWSDLVDFDLANASFIDSDGFIDFIASRFDARSFADLDTPLAVVATDYWSGEAHVFREGDLLQAIKASMAVPGMFPPVPFEDKLLIDGGASNPLPLDLLQGFDVVVAIDVTGSRRAERDGKPDITDLLFSAFEIMQQSILREKAEHARPDIYIKPELAGIRLLHFDRVDRIVAEAGDAAKALRDELAALPVCR